MRVLCACLVLITSLLTAVGASAANPVEILEVGLKGHYSSNATVPVRTRIVVPANTQSIRLEFTVRTGSIERYEPFREDHFSQVLSVTPGVIEVDTPLLLPISESARLELAVLDSAGQLIGKSSLALNSQTRSNAGMQFALICRDRALCDEVQSQISFSGSSDDVSEKDRRFRFVALDHPREHWWDYSTAWCIVLADPVSIWTAQERDALELYLRQGGRLVVMEKESNDPTFLGAYRSTDSRANPVLVGRGILWRDADLAGKTLGSKFTGETLKRLLNDSNEFQSLGRSFASTLRSRVGVWFTFPRLRWLLIWLAVYIMVVGLANFALLRRLGKMEWGWISTASIAVLFAFGFYFAGSANRPKQVTLDEIPIYWMDSRSGMAAESLSLRVSSPRQQTISLTAPDNAMLTPQAVLRSSTPNVQIAPSITQTQRMDLGREVTLGPLQVALSVLRWSFVDVDMEGSHTFPGSVTLSPVGHLKNATGQQFRDSIYLDFKDGKEYPIGNLSSDQEIDLKDTKAAPIWKGRKDDPQNWDFRPMLQHGTLSLSDISLMGLLSGRTKHVFIGISEGPVPAVTLSEKDVSHRNLIVTVVSLDQP